MGSFEKFLKDNKIQKQEIAQFLNVSRAFVTQLSQGTRKLPPDKMALIKANTAWDCSALDISGNVSQDNRQYYSDSPDVLRAEIDKLDRIIAEKEERIKEKDAQIKEKDAQIKALLEILKK